MNKVTVYTAPSCPYCVRAKELLKSRGVLFEEVHLTWEDDSAWDALTRRSGLRTVPQIFVGEKLVGGYQDLTALDKQDALESLK